jgi:hypothetical protein
MAAQPPGRRHRRIAGESHQIHNWVQYMCCLGACRRDWKAKTCSNNMFLFWACCQERLGVVVVLGEPTHCRGNVTVFVHGIRQGVRYALHFINKWRRFGVSSHIATRVMLMEDLGRVLESDMRICRASLCRYRVRCRSKLYRCCYSPSTVRPMVSGLSLIICECGGDTVHCWLVFSVVVTLLMVAKLAGFSHVLGVCVLYRRDLAASTFCRSNDLLLSTA